MGKCIPCFIFSKKTDTTIDITNVVYLKYRPTFVFPNIVHVYALSLSFIFLAYFSNFSPSFFAIFSFWWSVVLT